MLGTVRRGPSAGADELVECESVSECSGSDTVFIALAPDSFRRGVDGVSADKKPFSSQISEGRGHFPEFEDASLCLLKPHITQTGRGKRHTPVSRKTHGKLSTLTSKKKQNKKNKSSLLLKSLTLTFTPVDVSPLKAAKFSTKSHFILQGPQTVHLESRREASVAFPLPPLPD